MNPIYRKLRENRILQERADYSKYPVEQLVALAQDGDQLAMETLISTHKDFISMMGRKYILDNADKEDVEQLATIAFWDAINKYDPKTNGDFQAFAGMIIKRKMTDELRKGSADKRKSNAEAQYLDEPYADDEGGETTKGDKMAAPGLSPDEMILGKEGARALMKYMKDNFSELELEVVMKRIQGYSTSEIAEETDMPYKKVENTLNRLKGKLAEYMKSVKESKSFRRDKDVKFSDEEKQVLESVINKIQEEKTSKNTKVMRLKESYENYTEEQLEEELYKIEDEVDELASQIIDIRYDDRDDINDALDELHDRVYAMQDYIEGEDLFKKSEEVLTSIERTKDLEYEGPDKYAERSPWAERGISQSDFVKFDR